MIVNVYFRKMYLAMAHCKAQFQHFPELYDETRDKPPSDCPSGGRDSKLRPNCEEWYPLHREA